MEENIKYPIGIQTFSKIVEEKYAYVDKTRFIPLLENAGQFIFLSRPRRFGKSLLLSMMHSYFAGEKEYFKGLAIDSMNVEWKKRPVLHFDFNPENYLNENALEGLLHGYLKDFEKEYGIETEEMSPSRRFSNLVKNIHEKTGEQVVILIDEYDKPLLGLEDNKELFTKNQGILKGFFGVLKSMDRSIRFAMLTGVARFNKVSIFSDLNNLNDISLDEEFADICGWTQEELEKYFSTGIKLIAKKYKVSYEETLRDMKLTYDGYLFAEGGNRLYNPFSVLNALSKKRLSYFWFHTGTPTFLAKRVKKRGILLPTLNKCKCPEDMLTAVGIDDPNPIPLLFQTGYLTIRRTFGDIYELQFPNKEVEVGFARYLQPLYLPEMDDYNGPFSIWEFKEELNEGMPEKFMERMKAMIKAVPYEQHNEAFYQNLVYLLFTLIGIDSRMEEHTNQGRPDIVVRTEKFIYVFEFKYNGTVQEALDQIHNRDYAGRFGVDKRKVFLIGANFSTTERGLEGYEIEDYIPRI
ncbi:MAG: ATP-binding protein [Muribaculaceae bacterium]|nr:ATP-binding protein [Muribaculaceae bacterium]